MNNFNQLGFLINLEIMGEKKNENKGFLLVLYMTIR